VFRYKRLLQIGFASEQRIILSRIRVVTIDWVWIGELDLLTICIHNSELQVIILPLLISTLQITSTTQVFSIFTSRYVRALNNDVFH
jgi:hypothetical protein